MEKIRDTQGAGIENLGWNTQGEKRAMSSEQLIPNAVGRLDDVVEAIRNRDLDRAANLLDSEFVRLETKREQIRNDLHKVEKAISEVNHFRFKFRSEDEWERVRVACGGGMEVKSDE